MIENKNKKKAFLIGVGGIGVSALAKYLYFQNYEIYGSDQNKNENIEKLEKDFGLKFFLGQDGAGIARDFDLVIYTPAISFENDDYKKAKEFAIKTFSYPEFLGKISKKHFTVSIAGTNGKTTVTSMLTEILANENNFENASKENAQKLEKKVQKVKVDNSDTGVFLKNFSEGKILQKLQNQKESFFSIVGGVLPKFNSNFIYFGDEKFIVESCEFKRSFLNIFPNIVIITNITADHLDYYKDLKEIQDAFIDFLKNLKEKAGNEAKLICNFSEKNISPILEFCRENNIKIFDYSEFLTKDLRVSQEGQHNRENAAAVLKTAEILNLDIGKAKKYLANDFLGSKRRFEFLGKTENKAFLYDDYAHNPEGIEMIVNAVKKKYSDKKLLLLFHPHLFSRTKIFFNEFVEALESKNIDELVILPIFAAREKDKKEISSEDLENKLLKNGKIKKENLKVLTKEEAKKYLNQEKFNENWVILFAGAGDGNKILYNILDKKICKIEI